MAIAKKWYFKSLVLAVFWIIALWFFGQLYEAVVYSPNWIVDPVAQVARLKAFYAVTSARNYFEPIVPIGVLTLWVLFFVARGQAKKRLLPAFISSVLAMSVNIYIVVALLISIFSEENADDEALLHGLLMQWNIMNLVRIVLIGITMYFVSRCYLEIDRKVYLESREEK